MLYAILMLILDEPAGLDQLIEIRNVIKNAGKDKLFFLSTHIMQEVEAIATVSLSSITENRSR
jgi:ABC-type multidrug transport system ATPase subunit